MTDQVATSEAIVENLDVSTGDSSNVHKVQRQLFAIFDPENLAKDNFFRELYEKDPDHCE